MKWRWCSWSRDGHADRKDEHCHADQGNDGGDDGDGGVDRDDDDDKYDDDDDHHDDDAPHDDGEDNEDIYFKLPPELR